MTRNLLDNNFCGDWRHRGLHLFFHFELFHINISTHASLPCIKTTLTVGWLLKHVNVRKIDTQWIRILHKSLHVHLRWSNSICPSWVFEALPAVLYAKYTSRYEISVYLVDFCKRTQKQREAHAKNMHESRKWKLHFVIQEICLFLVCSLLALHKRKQTLCGAYVDNNVCVTAAHVSLRMRRVVLSHYPITLFPFRPAKIKRKSRKTLHVLA